MWQVVFVMKTRETRSTQGDDQAHADQQTEKHQNSLIFLKKNFIFEKKIKAVIMGNINTLLDSL